MKKQNEDTPIDQKKVDEAIEALKASTLEPATKEMILGILYSFGRLLEIIQSKKISIGRLRRWLFKTTEKAKNLLGDKNGKTKDKSKSDKVDKKDEAKDKDKVKEPVENNKHGRNSHDNVQTSKLVLCPHNLKAGDVCPKCTEGKVYPFKNSNFIQYVAQPLIDATKYQLEKFRCNLCQDIFEANLPVGIKPQKYEDNVGVALSVQQYGFSIPAYRSEQMLQAEGIPFSDSQMGVLTREVAESVGDPVYAALISHVANEGAIAIDDTTARIQEYSIENKSKAENERIGVFTVAVTGAVTGKPVAIFVTGRKHAGEVLTDILDQRTNPLPLQVMGDGSSKNISTHPSVIEVNCNTHNRRKFSDIIEAFPETSAWVIECYKTIYKNDADCKNLNYSAEARLQYHIENSLPIMKGMQETLDKKIVDHEVEPNSELGKAIKYFSKRYEKMIGFCKYPGALIDNNACERAIKKFVGHRKASLHYKTAKGAWVGERLMTLIQTAILNKVSPNHYLLTLVKNAKMVKLEPSKWFPWNYHLNPAPS